MRNFIIYVSIIAVFAGCGYDDSPKLPPVEERIEAATEELQELLLSPTFGWKLEYQPTSETGIFLILLEFNEDGTVRIQSDVPANDGEFRDHTVSYRIDNAQGIELIFETYAVFHYLFELQQATFGGEFEFIYVGEDAGNLVFVSKTDGASDVTQLEFEKATSVDSEDISSEAMGLLAKGIFQTENLAGIGLVSTYNLYLPDSDHTISLSFDLDRRRVKIMGAAVGQTEEEILTNNTFATSSVETTFSLEGESVVLDRTQTITLDGVDHDLRRLPIENAESLQQSFCSGSEETVTRFSSSADGLGDFEMTSSLFQVSIDFLPSEDDGFYSINYIFVYDENDNSISDQIEAVFPNVAAFQWYYGVGTSVGTLDALGFVVLDDFNNARFFLRGYDAVQNGNMIQLTFNGNDEVPDDATQEELDAMNQLTDLIFDGGTVYILDIITIDGIYEFYNPCNGYKGFLL